MSHEKKLERAIGDQIVALARRHDPKLTHSDLAQAAGVRRESMSRYLNGAHPMPLPAFLAVCEALEVSPAKVIAMAEAQVAAQD